jgi:hypothetical protein
VPSLFSSRAPERARPIAAHPPVGSRLGRRRGVPSCALAALAGLGLFALAGCKLVDQTTFAPAPAARARGAGAASAVPAAKIDARTPLLTIGPDTPVSGYRSLLSFAVHAAEQRDRNVRFDVTAVAPAQLAPAELRPARQTAETDAAETQATEVMRAMVQAGVPADRILLRVVLDPATTRHAVQVYVR